MTLEALEKAKELEKRLNKFDEVIESLNYRASSAKNSKDENPCNCNTRTSRFYKWKARFVNERNREGEEKAKVIVFDNDNVYGTDIEVDEDFIQYIRAYFENKKHTVENELDALN